MDTPLDTLVARIIASERVLSEDVLQLRHEVWADDDTITLAAADALFTINHSVRKVCPQWVDFFVEAVTAYLLEVSSPVGVLDDDKAAWLITQVGNEGNVENRAELLLIVSLLEKASTVAPRLRTYAIAQVERTVVTGEGSTRIGAALRPGVIDEAEVALLRRVFQTPQSGHVGISRDEAESLFRIKAATLGQDNAPSWTLLFVQLVGQFLIEGPVEAPGEQKLSLLAMFMAEAMPGVGAFLDRLEATHGAAEGVAEPEPMTADEATWLKAQIVADGVLDDIEKALLAFVLDEAGPLPAQLDALTATPHALSA